jgi:hypothetical protein
MSQWLFVSTHHLASGLCGIFAPLASDQPSCRAATQGRGAFVAANEGAQPNPAPLDATDQAAVQNAWQTTGPQDFFLGGLAQKMAATAQIQDHANRKAELAQAVSSGSQMRVDPAEVDALARFFEDEAQRLEGRERAVTELATIEPPGTDPVSTQAASKYGEVASGNGQGYLENYKKLAQVFHDTAASLRTSAQQTRTNDQDAADSFRGGNLA